MNRADIEDIYGLTPLQQGMLFHNLYEPEAGIGYEQVSCRLEGELDVAAFARAWAAVVKRHSILRTAFVREGVKEPLQVVRREVELPIRQEDWRAASKAEQEQRLNEYLKQERERGIDPSHAPLMRLSLLRLGEQSYQLVWSRHHLLMDGWSRPLLMKEMLSYYEAFRKGQELELPEVRPYRDYIGWLQQQDRKAAEQYWRAQLQGLQQPTELARSIGRERTVVLNEEERYAEATRQLSDEFSARLRALSREQKLTINTVLQGAWAVLLSRYSGELEVVYGAVVAGRPAELAGVEQMVGLFINTLPVRVQAPGRKQIASWLQELQAAQVEMRQYEYSSLAQVQSWSSVNHGQRLFDNIFVFENFPTRDYLSGAIGNLNIHDGQLLTERTGYPLTFIAEHREQLGLKISYDRHAFDDRTSERLLDHFENVLEGIVANPEQRLAGLALLSERERQQLVVDWNDTDVVYEGPVSVHELFARQVEQTPDSVAVVFAGEQLTYAELNERANQLGHYLRALGVGAEVRVGVLLERSIEMMVALIGVMKAGSAYVPLDPAYPRERLKFMAGDAELAVLLTQESLRELVELPASTQLVCVDSEQSSIAECSNQNPSVAVNAGNLAYLIYTSGSTGTPKAVAIEHHSTTTLINWALGCFPQSALSSVLASTSLCFDLSVFELFVPLSCGGQVVLVENALALPQLSPQTQVSLINTVPSAMSELVRQALPASVAVINLAGEALGRALVESIYEQLPESAVYNLYGPSEDTTYSTAALIARGDATPSIGRPVANTQAYVLDRELQLVPAGVSGELYLSGAGVARGYLGRAELTAERFLPNPYSLEAGARMYRTGDLARHQADGNLEYLGRADKQVKIRGYRIELGEVEAVLGKHPSVSQAVVVAHATENRLVAYVVADDGDSSEWREYLQQRLPHYMIPSVFVRLEALPLTTNGKVDRRALPAPETVLTASSTGMETARTPTEELLCGIWSEVLRRAETGVTENFFELGGHSLLATQVLSRMQAVFKIAVPLRTLFEAPTIRELAERVEQALQTGTLSQAPPLKPVGRDQSLPLSFAQQRLWFLAQLEPDNAFYNSPLAVRLKGELQLTALQQTLEQLLARHEVLRTSFVVDQGKPWQLIENAEGQALEVIELSELSEAEREAAVQELAAREAAQPFDLSRGPLLRVKLVRLNEQEHVLLVTMHHIVSDGWSMGVLIKEVSELYSAYASGREPELPVLPIQYADYASWQREWLQGEVLEEQVRYWREQLEGAPPVLELPADNMRPAVQSYRGGHERFALDEAISAGLKELSRREGATLFMVLLAAFQVLLMRYSGQEDVVVGTPIAGRQHKEVEELIGFFVNTLVLRTNLSGDPSFRELLRRVREVCLGAYSHQDLPFEKLVEELQPKRDLNYPPLVQVALGLQNGPQEVVRLSGLQATPLNAAHETVRYDLTLWIMEGASQLHCLWTYNADVFETDTIRLMARRFGTLLRNIVDHPLERLSGLEMVVVETEKAEQLVKEKALESLMIEKLVTVQRKAIQVLKVQI